MKNKKLEIGDIVQLHANHPKFPLDFIIVTEPKEFGCQGYILMARINDACRYDGLAYIRAKFEDFEYVGKCTALHEKNNKDEKKMKIALSDNIKDEYCYHHLIRSRNMILDACTDLLYKDLAIDMLIKILVEICLCDENESVSLENLIEMVSVEYQSLENITQE